MRGRSRIITIILLSFLLFLVLVNGGCFQKRDVTRGGIIKDLIFIVIGEAIVIGIFYFAFYHFMLRMRFHHFVAHSISLAITALYSLCLISVIVLPYQLLEFWQWIALFLILGLGWLLLSIFLIVSSNR